MHNSSDDPFLGDLNEAQRRAVTHGDAPLLIVAGAGTGKTTTLARRVAWLVKRGVDPNRILLLTFTRRSAAEMLRRVDTLLAGSGSGYVSRSIWGGTFHAVAVRLLRQGGSAIGLPQNFTILDRTDSEDVIGNLRADLGLSDSKNHFPGKPLCTEIYSRVVNSQLPLEEVLEKTFPAQRQHLVDLKALFKAYTARKERDHLLDYDDLLLFWDALLSESTAAQQLQDRFTHVLVDEYQDTNRLQASILKHLRPDGTGVTVVGDDAQAIYGFRAATVRNILDFPQDYPGAEVIPLERNYRSTQSILDLANTVISAARERHEKSLQAVRAGGVPPVLVRCRDEQAQSESVVDQVLAHADEGIALGRQAVLFRASHHSLNLELELNRRGVPFKKFGGLKLLETAHVKDLLAFLRVAENPRDTLAAERVLTLLPGIGRKTAGSLIDRLAQSGFRLGAAWADFKPPASTRDLWPNFMALLSSLEVREESTSGPGEQVRSIRWFYAPLLESRYDHASARMLDLQQLEYVAETYKDRTVFLADLALDPPTSVRKDTTDRDAEEDRLILSTIHSAKGLEFDSVHLLNVTDGAIPSDMAMSSAESLDEERRLFYVALTRARNFLHLYHPLAYATPRVTRGGGFGFATLSRFVTPEMQQAMALVSVGTEPAVSVTTGDIRRRIGQMWD